MSQMNGFIPGEMLSVVKFVRGYRYLDRCGEILLRLEDDLGDGWIPGEASPNAGIIRNVDMGMEVVFNSDSMTVRQRELVVDEQLIHTASRVYEIICGAIEIDHVLAPTLRTVFQKRCDSIVKADETLMMMGLVLPSGGLCEALGGEPSIQHFTVVRETETTWEDLPVHCRVRINCIGSGQFQQPPFDDRLVRRARTLPTRQNDALKQLLAFREKFVSANTFSTSLDIEYSFEDEFPFQVFQYREFLQHALRNIQASASALARSKR